jgi:hypothetical protein
MPISPPGSDAAVVNDFPIHDLAGPGHHLQDGPGGHGLAATAFADDAHRLSSSDLKSGPVHGFDDAITHVELNL